MTSPHWQSDGSAVFRDVHFSLKSNVEWFWMINRISPSCLLISNISTLVDKSKISSASLGYLLLLSTCVDIFDIRRHLGEILYMFITFVNVKVVTWPFYENNMAGLPIISYKSKINTLLMSMLLDSKRECELTGILPRFSYLKINVQKIVVLLCYCDNHYVVFMSTGVFLFVFLGMHTHCSNF